MCQTLVKLAFNARYSGVVDVGIADNMGKQVFVRINAFFAVFKFQPRNAEIINLVLLRRGEVTFDIYKTAPAFEFGQNVFITQIGKNPCQLNGRLLRV